MSRKNGRWLGISAGAPWVVAMSPAAVSSALLGPATDSSSQGRDPATRAPAADVLSGLHRVPKSRSEAARVRGARRQGTGLLGEMRVICSLWAASLRLGTTICRPLHIKTVTSGVGGEPVMVSGMSLVLGFCHGNRWICLSATVSVDSWSAPSSIAEFMWRRCSSKRGRCAGCHHGCDAGCGSAAK
jgi:hypothetical protein